MGEINSQSRHGTRQALRSAIGEVPADGKTDGRDGQWLRHHTTAGRSLCHITASETGKVCTLAVFVVAGSALAWRLRDLKLGDLETTRQSCSWQRRSLLKRGVALTGLSGQRSTERRHWLGAGAPPAMDDALPHARQTQASHSPTQPGRFNFGERSLFCFPSASIHSPPSALPAISREIALEGGTQLARCTKPRLPHFVGP